MLYTRLTALFLFASVALGVESASAQLPQDRLDQAARDLSVGGVKLGSSVQEFLERIPTAVEGRTANAVRMPNDYLVLVNSGKEHPPKVFFRFKDEIVSSITIEYSRASLEELSEIAPIIEQLEKRFGKHTKQWQSDFVGEGQIFAWELPHVGRWISFMEFDDGKAQLFIREYSANEAAADSRPKTSILGFDTEPQESSVLDPPPSAS